MSICEEFITYGKALTNLSSCSSAKAPVIVSQLVESGLSIANDYEAKQHVLLHELFLRRVFYDLLEKVCDPLINHVVRNICLDHMYQPLVALKKFYKKQHAHLYSYYQLERELRVLSIEFLKR